MRPSHKINQKRKEKKSCTDRPDNSADPLSGSFFPTVCIIFPHDGFSLSLSTLMMVSLTPKGDSLRHSFQKPVRINTESILQLHVSIRKLISAGRNILDQIPARQLG